MLGAVFEPIHSCSTSSQHCLEQIRSGGPLLKTDRFKIGLVKNVIFQQELSYCIRELLGSPLQRKLLNILAKLVVPHDAISPRQLSCIGLKKHHRASVEASYSDSSIEEAVLFPRILLATVATVLKILLRVVFTTVVLMVVVSRVVLGIKVVGGGGSRVVASVVDVVVVLRSVVISVTTCSAVWLYGMVVTFMRLHGSSTIGPSHESSRYAMALPPVSPILYDRVMMFPATKHETFFNAAAAP